jgi:hypothetical protein
MVGGPQLAVVFTRHDFGVLDRAAPVPLYEHVVQSGVAEPADRGGRVVVRPGVPGTAVPATSQAS